MDVRKRLIQLHASRHISWKLLKKFFLLDPSLYSIFQMSKGDLQQNFLLTDAQTEKIFHDLHYQNVSTLLQYYTNEGIQLVTIFDKEYPHLLKHIYDPPWMLYCKGKLKLLSVPDKISVVGTRDPSENGIYSLKKIVEPLIEKGWLVVSGLAVGIDASAHQIAINNGGTTIAVLASGFHHIYPRCHNHLSSVLAKDHLLISEYPPNRKPEKWYFPMRNRIISGLSKGTLIIEARKRSGSLITADLALQQGREVFSVPGSILEARSEGTNWLIQQGAKLTNSSDDVLNEL